MKNIESRKFHSYKRYGGRTTGNKDNNKTMEVNLDADGRQIDLKGAY
jgi:hypothetical protein